MKLTIIFCLLPSGALALAQALAPVVDVGNAQYQGITDARTNITSYLGIRYAASPSGELRWRAPVDPPVLSGVQKAVALPPACPQAAANGQSHTNPFPKPGLVRRASTDPEDCLFLNVYFPGNSVSAQSLPVVVWIHGGGYIAGTPGADGSDLVWESNNGVVVVAIQYRLGIFGFLAGSEVKADGNLNAGLLDQDFALQWVHKNICHFGGDPRRVTIWGASAGAGSVLQQVVARNGRTWPPLFRAAITSSSYLPSQYLYNDTIPEYVFREVVSQTGCSKAPKVLACLRAADVNILLTANTDINRAGFYGTFVTVPVVDGDFITQRPTEAFRKRQVNGLALLSMTNTHDGDTFVDLSIAPTLSAADYATTLFPGMKADQATNISQLYSTVGSRTDQISAIISEAIFVCPTYHMLRAFPLTSFKGEFAVPPGRHGQDQAYYFLSHGTPPFNNPTFIKSFSQSFLAFAKSLDPNIKYDKNNTTPQWWQYVFENTEMLFNRTTVGQADIRAFKTNKALLQRCAFWESISRFTSQ